MHRGTVEPDQTGQTTALSLPEENSQSTEQEQTQEQVTEAADTESDENFNVGVDVDIEGVSTLPPVQIGGALTAGVAAAYLLKRRL